ncbi:reverse transcriptase domain-containing protein [Tanacetum coccineum]|uniref:Reverse transcriptase domain-containing protein n=1 Tax=Tanacetum coccineum TaxID=301880 RepID=A0ABQ5AP79_9ASTR
MSSPNHPTSDIEDAFSFNFSDYTPTLPNYFPVSPGNISPNPSDNLSKYLLASLAISPFHDDPYMQAYNAAANEPPIPLQTPIDPPPVLPPSLVLPLSPIMAPKRTSTSTPPPMTQAAIKKLVTNSVATTLEAQAATMASTSNLNRNTGPTGTPSWWNAYAQPIGIEQANKINWTELKRLLTSKYCPRTEVRKMEDEFYNLTVKGDDLKTYIRRFQELTVLCPNMVPNTEKLVEAFIRGLPRSIEGNVTASKPQT